MDARRKHNFNQNFLDTVDAPEKAYFLGWAYSDGCNSKKGGKFNLSLQERDEGVLRILNKCLDSTYPLYFIRAQKETHQNQKRLTLNSVYFSEKLNELGVVPNKSLKLEIPIEKFPPNLIKFLIRGWFEGDGHFSWKRKGQKFRAALNIVCCAPIAVKQLAFLIERYSGQSISVYNYKKHSSVRFASIRDIYRFLLWLYSDRTDLCLNRKFIVVNDFIKAYKDEFFNGKDIRRSKIFDQDKVNIQNLRRSGLTIEEISEKVTLSSSAVFKNIRFESDYKSKMKKFSINKDSILDIGTDNGSYLFGWLMSKGSLNQDTKTVSITDREREKLELIQSICNSERPIRQTPTSFCFSISGNEIYDELEKLGLKAGSVSFHEINEENYHRLSLRHFIIGMLDARGSVYFRKDRREMKLYLRIPRLDLAIKIKDSIKNMTGISLNIVNRNQDMPFLEVTGTKAPMKIIDFLYGEQEVVGDFFIRNFYLRSHSFLSGRRL